MSEQKMIPVFVYPDSIPERRRLEDELKLRGLRAKVLLDEAKAEREMIAIDADRLEVDKKNGLLCYSQVALSEFSAVLKHLYDDLKRLPQTLIDATGASPQQATAITQAVEALLIELSEVKVDLSTTRDIDNRRGDYTSHRTLQETISAVSEIKK